MPTQRTPNDDALRREEELVTAPPLDPREDVNAELDPEVAARALRQVAENERLEREAAYDNPDPDLGDDD